MLEAFALVLSVVAVWLTLERRPLCWPVGLVSVLAYAVVFLDSRLYSDTLLQLFYAALNLYGWWQWRRLPAAEGRPEVQPLSAGAAVRDLAVGALGALGLGALVRWLFPDAALPWLDAALTSFSLVAQWWMARMVRANWLLWIAVDVVYVAMYVNRGLLPTAALYAGFVALAAWAWVRWGRPPDARIKVGPAFPAD